MRKPTHERREEIADAALEIIGRRGLPALTTAALAEAIGLTSGALFRHFGSREEILDEAVRVAEARLEATFPDPSVAPLERLRGLAEGRIRLLGKEPGIAWLLRSGQAFLALPPAGVKRLKEIVQRSRTYIRAALEEAQETEQVRADVPVDVLLLAFTSMVHALIDRPGVHGRSARTAKPDRALAGLFQLLSP